MASPRPELLGDAAEVEEIRTSLGWRFFDSRSGEVYRGEKKGYDPIAGQIPGAISVPYSDNVGPDGRFLLPEQLKARFEPMLDDVPAEKTVFYCGSGVTASHNLLALAHAGLLETLVLRRDRRREAAGIARMRAADSRCDFYSHRIIYMVSERR